MIKFLGIDPGLRKTGWGIIHSNELGDLSFIAAGSITTHTKTDLAERLLIIFNEISQIMREYSPHHAAIEDTYVSINYHSSLQLSHARAASIIAAYNSGVKPIPYPATVIKKAITGKGNADKSQIIKMIKIWLPTYEITSDKDASDALAIAICHARHFLNPVFSA